MPFWLAPRGVQHQRFHQVWRAISGLPAWQGSGKVRVSFCMVSELCCQGAKASIHHRRHQKHGVPGNCPNPAHQACALTFANKAAAPAGQCKQQPGRCRKLWIRASAPPTVCYPLGVPLRRHQQATSAISAPPAQRCNAGFVGLQARLQNVGFGAYQLAYRLFAHQLNARVRGPKAEVF